MRCMSLGFKLPHQIQGEPDQAINGLHARAVFSNFRGIHTPTAAFWVCRSPESGLLVQHTPGLAPIRLGQEVEVQVKRQGKGRADSCKFFSHRHYMVLLVPVQVVAVKQRFADFSGFACDTSLGRQLGQAASFCGFVCERCCYQTTAWQPKLDTTLSTTLSLESC